MLNDFDTLIKYISDHFIFNENKYPELAGADEHKRFLFALRHSALHFSKTAGNIAAISEQADHGAPVDLNNLKTQTIKALINTFRLAELIDINGEQLVAGVQDLYKK